MPEVTRRELLRSGGAVAAAVLGTRLVAQQPTPAPTDSMTADIAAKPQVYPAYSFGPLPTTLPAETAALRGKHSLEHHAHHHGLITGAAVVVRVLQNDPVLQQLIREQYGILVPENELKWHALRPSIDRFDFTASDWLFDFAAANHLAMRGHNLAWHNSIPEWLQQSASTLDVRALFVEHIRTVVGRYRGRVHSWDVVNEAVFPKDGLPDGMRKTFWSEHIGPDYIELAFRTAHQADPHARLTYNDYSVEYDNPDDAAKRAAILALLARLQAKSVPIHAVGIQAHLHAGGDANLGKGLADYIAAIQRMGLEVYLTELDVSEDDLSTNDISQRDRAVADTYKTVLDVSLPNSAVKLVLTWGVSDRRTWLNDLKSHRTKHPDRPQRSLPFDSEYKPKLACFAMRDSFDRRRS